MKYPVGVNLASGNTGLFTQCMNGATGCAPARRRHDHDLRRDHASSRGTGIDDRGPGRVRLRTASRAAAPAGSSRAATSTGGEIITLRIAIWDTSDRRLDSLAVIDNFQWSVDVVAAGHGDLQPPPNLAPFNPFVPQNAY